MSQNFKLRIDQMRESKPTQQDGSEGQDGLTSYTNSGHIRNVSFQWPNGKRHFFNYSYLLDGEFDPLGEKNTIKLFFTSHTVLIHGYSLLELYNELFENQTRVVIITDSRYATNEECTVTEVIVETKDS